MPKTSKTNLMIEIRIVIACRVRVGQLTEKSHEKTFCQHRGVLYFVSGRGHVAAHVDPSSLKH